MRQSSPGLRRQSWGTCEAGRREEIGFIYLISTGLGAYINVRRRRPRRPRRRGGRIEVEMRVLLVDDSRSSLAQLTLMLQQCDDVETECVPRSRGRADASVPTAFRSGDRRPHHAGARRRRSFIAADAQDAVSPADPDDHADGERRRRRQDPCPRGRGDRLPQQVAEPARAVDSAAQHRRSRARAAQARRPRRVAGAGDRGGDPDLAAARGGDGVPAVEGARISRQRHQRPHLSRRASTAA